MGSAMFLWVLLLCGQHQVAAANGNTSQTSSDTLPDNHTGPNTETTTPNLLLGNASVETTTTALDSLDNASVQFTTTSGLAWGNSSLSTTTSGNVSAETTTTLDLSPVQTTTNASTSTETDTTSATVTSTTTSYMDSVTPAPVTVQDISCGSGVFGSTVGLPSRAGTSLSGEAVFRVCPDLTAAYTFSACGSAFDTILRLYSSGFEFELSSNDDSAACYRQSQLTEPLTAGECYMVLLEGYWDAEGFYSLTVTCDFLVTDPPTTITTTTTTTTTPKSWTPIACGDRVQGSTEGQPNIIGNLGGDQVYTICTDFPGEYTFDVCNSFYDTTLRVFTAGLKTQLAELDDGGCPVRQMTRLTLDLESGLCYDLVVEGWSSREGEYNLAVECGTHTTTTVTTVTTTSTFSKSQLECNSEAVGSTLHRPNLAGDPAGDAEFEFCAGMAGAHTFDSCGTDFPSILHVFDQGAQIGVCRHCGQCGGGGMLNVTLEPGRCYTVFLGGVNSTHGNFRLAVSCPWEASGPPELLYSGLGNNHEHSNSWRGWYDRGHLGEGDLGKRVTYDLLPLRQLNFSDETGRFAVYNVVPPFTGMTLLQIVQACMPTEHHNNFSSAWVDGHCFPGVLSESRGLAYVSSHLRIGVGDGQAAPGDWALFMLQTGNANGDFEGNAAYAFGSEGWANTGYSGRIVIEARASGQLLSLQQPRASLTCGSRVNGSTTGLPDLVGNKAGDAFLEFCPSRDGLYAFNACGSSFDTVLHVFLRGLIREVASCDDCGPCGQQTVLTTRLTGGVCYDVVVEGSGQSEGDFDVLATCCSRQQHCNGRGEAIAGWDGTSCSCICDSGFGGSTCERCDDTTDRLVLIFWGTIALCQPCVPSGAPDTYVAAAGSTLTWRLNLLHPACYSNVQVSTRAADHTVQQYTIAFDRTVSIQMPDCTADDAPSAPSLSLFLNDRVVGTVYCSPILSCPTTVTQTQPNNATVHIHFLDYTVATAQTVLSSFTLLRNLALDSRDAIASAPVNVSAAFDGGSLVTDRAELQALYNTWISPSGVGNPYIKRTTCTFLTHDVLQLPTFDIPGQVRLLVLAGDMPTCPEMQTALQQIVHSGVKVLWVGETVMPMPFLDSIGVGALVYQQSVSKSLASELCRLTEAKHQVSVPCGTSNVTFAPTQVTALQRPRLHLHGACDVEACCLGGTRHCSRLTDGGTSCYLPFAGELAEQEVTLMLRDGSHVTEPRLLQTTSASPGLYTAVVQRDWRGRNTVSIQQSAAGLPGSFQAERCCQFVGVGLYDQTVMRLGQQQCWSVSAWWGSGTLNVGSLGSVPFVLDRRAFTQPVQTLAVRCHSPVVQGGMADGQSFPTDAATRTPPDDRHLMLPLGVSIWTRNAQIDQYVNQIVLRAWVSQGKSLEAVRHALEAAGLRSHYPPEEKACTATDVPDAEGRCHWAWCAEAKDAGPYLVSAGFRAIPTDWSTSNAVRGDLVVIPPFTAVHSNTSAAVVNTMGDIAIMIDHDGHWTSDNNMALTLLPHLHSITGTPPMLYRLREDVEVPPEPHEEFEALPLLKDLVGDTGARNEFFATWPGVDAQDNATQQAKEMVDRYYPCPAFWADSNFMPMQLVEATAMPQAASSSNCYEMRPTVGRPYGVRCCYIFNEYITGWPSRVLVHKPGVSDWWDAQEEAIEHLAFVAGSCEGDPMPLPVQMARLAEGASRYKGSSSPSARTGGAVRAGWQYTDAVCGSSAGAGCAILSRRGSDCAVAFRAPDTTSGWMGPSQDDVVTLVNGTVDGLNASGFKVHGAMYRLAQEVIVNSRLVALTTDCSSVHYVGHGFGGAMASMAFLLRWNDPTVHLHTFGQPRILTDDTATNVNAGVCARVRRYVVQSVDAGCGDKVPEAFARSGFKHFGEQWNIVINGSKVTTDLVPQSCSPNRPDSGLPSAALRFAGERFEIIGRTAPILSFWDSIFALSEKVEPECLLLHKLQRYTELLERAHSVISGFTPTTCAAYETRRPPAQATNMPYSGDFHWTPKRPPGAGWGDPHCRSYDGLEFECNFRGEAVWTQCNQWAVHVVAQPHFPLQQATVLKEFAVRFDSDVVSGFVYNDGSFEVHLNGVLLSATQSSSKFRVDVQRSTFDVEGWVKVEDVAGNIVVAQFYSGLIFLLVFPSESCLGHTSGLMGNSDGNPLNDLQAPDASQLEANATATDVYNAFALKWCVTNRNASLFPVNSFSPCDKSFIPWFLDTISDSQLPQCSLCQGNRRCCFDVAVGGNSLAQPNLDAQRSLEQLVSDASHAAGWAPSFLAAPAWIAVTPTGSEQLVTSFRAETTISTIVSFTCSVCEDETTARVHSIRCEVQGLGSVSATLNLYAFSLPAGRMDCRAEDHGGRSSRSATTVELLQVMDATTAAPTTSVVAQDSSETSSAQATTSTGESLTTFITSTPVPVVVTATLDLETTDPEAFVQDAKVKAGMAEGLARWVDVEPSAVQVELSIIENIQTEGNLRRLQAPNVRCMCTIATTGVEKAKEVASALSPDSWDEQTAQLAAALDEKTRPVLYVITVLSVTVTSSPEAGTTTERSGWRQDEVEDESTVSQFLWVTAALCLLLFSGCFCCIWRHKRLKRLCKEESLKDLRGSADVGKLGSGSSTGGASISLDGESFCDLTVEEDPDQTIQSAKFCS